MDSQQAKKILELYRPGVDDTDTQFAEALALTRRDPELARWLEGQTALDAVIRGKLRDVAIPVGLKTRILANAKVESPAIAWWPRLGYVAVAAAVVAIIAPVVAVRLLTSFASYRAEMVKFVSVKYDLDLHTESFDEVQQGLAKNGWPSDYVVPAGLKQISIEGGCLRQWHGHKVSLICMEAKDRDVWLFVVESKGLRDTPPATPVFAKAGKITTASWTAGNLTYMLVTEGDEPALRKYL